VSQAFGFSLANSGNKSVVAGFSSYLPAPPDFFLYFLHSSVLNGIKYRYERINAGW
jgi:hypothetical protein